MLVYLTVMLNPLIPLVKDAISHSFSEAYHISVIHAKYGANHLENELAGSASENDKDKNQSSIKSEEQIPVHVSIKEYEADFSFSIINKYQPAQKNISLPVVFLAKHCPPPKFI